MTTPSRRDDIAAYVTSRGEVRIDELVTTFGVSRMTIHRHIEELSRQGVLRKTHGAVSAQPSGVYESLFGFRLTRATAAKEAIAQAAAAAEVQAGQIVLLDDSTTVAAIVPHLARSLPLTVMTNSLPNAVALSAMEEVRLISFGGDYHATYNAFIGHLCESAVSRVRANLAICSTSAISGTSALIQDPQVTRVKQAMLAAASRKVLLVDQTKFDKVALHLFADLTDFDAIYTDATLPKDIVQRLHDAGTQVIQVPLP